MILVFLIISSILIVTNIILLWVLGLIKTRLASFHLEDTLQNTLMVVEEERRQVKVARNGKLSKEEMQRMIRRRPS